MPISSVWSGPSVYSVVSSVPSVAGAGAAAAAIAAAAGGAAGGPADVLVFSRVLWSTGPRGDPVQSGLVTATLTGSVALKGQPTVPGAGREGASASLRPETQTTFEITTDSDPGVALGAPLKTNDGVAWAGFDLLVVGTAIPQGSGWLTKAVLTL